MTRRERHLAGAAGLLGIALGALAVPLDRMWAFPGSDATPASIAAFAAANRATLLAAMILTCAAVALWLPFGAGVWHLLRAGGQGEGMLPACFLAGLAGCVVLLLAGFAVFFLLVYRAPGSPEPKLLYDLSFALLAISGLPTALAMGSFAILAFADRALPPATAWLAILAGTAHLALLGSLVVPGGFFSLEGGVTIAIPATLFAWIAATSAALLAEPGRALAATS